MTRIGGISTLLTAHFSSVFSISAQTQVATDQKALPDLDKKASADTNGDADAKLGETYMSYGQYDKAIEALKRALGKGNVKAPDEARLHLGIAYYYSKRMGDAISEFKKVPADSKYVRVAKLWAIHAQNSKG